MKYLCLLMLAPLVGCQSFWEAMSAGGATAATEVLPHLPGAAAGDPASIVNTAIGVLATVGAALGIWKGPKVVKTGATPLIRLAGYVVAMFRSNQGTKRVARKPAKKKAA